MDTKQSVLPTLHPFAHWRVLYASRGVSLLAIALTVCTAVVGGEAAFMMRGWMFGTPHLIGLCLNMWSGFLFRDGTIDDSIFFLAVNMVAAYVFFGGF